MAIGRLWCRRAGGAVASARSAKAAKARRNDAVRQAVPGRRSRARWRRGPDAGVAPGTGGATGRAAHGGLGGTGDHGFYRMERLVRGVVACASPAELCGLAHVRLRAQRRQPESVSYALYRNGARAPGCDSTNYLDATGRRRRLHGAAVIGGVEGADSEAARPGRSSICACPAGPPAATCRQLHATRTRPTATAPTTPCPPTSTATALREHPQVGPSNARTTRNGLHGNVIIDAYQRTASSVAHRSRPNIRAGAHYTSSWPTSRRRRQGRAGVKTAPGTRTAPDSSCASARPPPTTTPPASHRLDRIRAERPRVLQRVQRPDRRRDGDRAVRRAAGTSVRAATLRQRVDASCPRWPTRQLRLPSS